jgi:hypothetical protein
MKSIKETGLYDLPRFREHLEWVFKSEDGIFGPCPEELDMRKVVSLKGPDKSPSGDIDCY